MNNTELIFFLQACINSYKGKWGEAVPIFDFEEEFSSNHTEGFFGYKDNDLYIVFQGSIGIWDWVDNIRFRQNENGIHRGFYRQYLSVEKIIKDKILQNWNRIYVLGHSLGGATATIATVELYKIGIQSTCVTFGCPKVGNSQFSLLHNTLCCDTIRVVNSGDIVPKLPALRRYTHVVEPIIIANGRFGILSPITSHDPRSYLKSLKG